MQPMKIAADRERANGRGFDDLADADDCLPVEPVGYMTHHQHQQEHGKKLH
jgi:hypothetical protein